MKKYFAPEIEVVELEMKDIMALSANATTLENITPEQGETNKGWIPDFDKWGL